VRWSVKCSERSKNAETGRNRIALATHFQGSGHSNRQNCVGTYLSLRCEIPDRLLGACSYFLQQNALLFPFAPTIYSITKPQPERGASLGVGRRGMNMVLLAETVGWQ